MCLILRRNILSNPEVALKSWPRIMRRVGTLKNLCGNWATITYFKKGDCSKLREAPTLSNSSELSHVPVCDILVKYKNVTLLANDGVSDYAISEVQSIEQQSKAMDITEP